MNEAGNFYEAGRNQAEMISSALLFAAADGETEGRERAEQSEGGAGGFVGASGGDLCAGASGSCFGGARIAAALRVAVSVPGDFDLESLLERRHARVEFVPDFDILAVAEQRAVGLRTRGLAAAFELGFTIDEALVLAIDLALHVDVGVTRARARRVALRLTIGARRGHFTLRVALAVARRLAGRTATIGIRGACASSVAASRTVGFA